MGKFLEGVGDELTLYVRQLAWLNAVPVPKEQASIAVAAAKPVSRLERMKADGRAAPLPFIELPEIVAWLMDIGPTIATGMGAAPIDWDTISCWQANVGAVLTPWEARTIRGLSRDFLAMAERAKDPDCPPPWSTGMDADSRRAVAAKVDAFLEALANRPPPKQG